VKAFQKSRARAPNGSQKRSRMTSFFVLKALTQDYLDVTYSPASSNWSQMLFMPFIDG